MASATAVSASGSAYAYSRKVVAASACPSRAWAWRIWPRSTRNVATLCRSRCSVAPSTPARDARARGPARRDAGAHDRPDVQCRLQRPRTVEFRLLQESAKRFGFERPPRFGASRSAHGPYRMCVDDAFVVCPSNSGAQGAEPSGDDGGANASVGPADERHPHDSWGERRDAR